MINQIHETLLPGCYEIFPQIHKDNRGIFVKTFNKDVFITHRLKTDFSEEYYSVSRQCVLRGLHFQTPPYDHVKLVYCVSGKVIDAILDIRVGSPAYGRFIMLEVSAEQSNILYIPSGLAHGFYVVSDYAVMIYKVSTVYSPEHDTGILWNSAGIPWPNQNPIMSQRDCDFISFKEFQSPFHYSEYAAYE